MIERSISATIRKSAAQVPVVTLLGPRQAGKTALVRELFPEYTYVNLEDRSARELAENDYLGFFSRYPEPLIIDEVQRVPELLSAIQVRVDEDRRKTEGSFSHSRISRGSVKLWPSRLPAGLQSTRCCRSPLRK